jgi:hypothetical protein
MQVAAKSSRSGGRRGSKRPRVSHYSKYSRTRYNARTYQEVIKVNKEEYSK